VPGIGKETPVRDVSSVAVIGAGTLGAGIAYACLAAGFGVRLLDKDEAGLGRGIATVEKLFEGGVARGKIDRKEMQASMERFRAVSDFAELKEVDLVIEAVFENMAIKKEVFARLDAICKKGAVLATNTSTLDVDEIASATSRPQDVIGLHFFSPAHIMRLLETVRGRETSDDVVATSLALARKLEKVG